MFRYFNLIDRGPEGTWCYLAWRYLSLEAAQEALPAWQKRYPRSQFEIVES